MIIYLEKSAKKYELTDRIINKFPDSKIIEIDNYKNIFDKNINFHTEKCLILATLDSNGITEVPNNYSRFEKAFFFKTSLNCPFDCTYCYLKGAFRNNFQTIFVNYEEIQKTIENKILEVRSSGYSDIIMFYASDYSDTLAMDNITEFHPNFIPFFEKFPNVLVESRTKSSNIELITRLGFVPKNTEIAFSLNPKEVIIKYEKGSSYLQDRIDAINILLDKGFKIGLRFIPLLPVNNYLEIYSEFLNFIISEIDLSRINSIEIGSLLYTIEDYNKIIKKESNADILYKLNEVQGDFIRSSRDFRDNIYELFNEKLGKFNICLDNYEK